MSRQERRRLKKGKSQLAKKEAQRQKDHKEILSFVRAIKDVTREKDMEVIRAVLKDLFGFGEIRLDRFENEYTKRRTQEITVDEAMKRVRENKALAKEAENILAK